MKVYAEYFKNNDGCEYRRKTLLQFGNSSQLIGSAVLINPGSAKPIGDPDIKFLQDFYMNNHQESFEQSLWKQFTPDSTMNQLEKIFNGWYVGKSKKLDGVIQLFNCFYYRDANLYNAITKAKNSILFNEARYFKDKPVWFGWGNVGKNELNEITEPIFEAYDKSLTPIYLSDFKANKFSHPGYVNRAYHRDKNLNNLLVAFFDLFK